MLKTTKKYIKFMKYSRDYSRVFLIKNITHTQCCQEPNRHEEETIGAKFLDAIFSLIVRTLFIFFSKIFSIDESKYVVSQSLHDLSLLFLFSLLLALLLLFSFPRSCLFCLSIIYH